MRIHHQWGRMQDKYIEIEVGVQDKTPKTIAIRQFNKQVLEDQRVHASLQTIGDGMLLIRRLQ